MSGFKKLIISVWFFPLLLTIALGVLTVFAISGTSIGAYNQLFYGIGKDPQLISGQPRYIRSDEWLVNTQLTIAQESNGYESVNKNIGDGENMAVLNDVPYKEWSTIFKPQNWSFFVLPFDNAFAFKWWVMLYLLILSCYFFTLKLLPDRKWVAIFLSVGLASSPFIQWWYQYATIAPIYYSFFICLALIWLFTVKGVRKKLLIGLLLAYLSICFALIVYPPFQIPCAIIIAAFSIGYVIELLRKTSFRQQKSSLLIGAGAVVVALIVVGGFLLSHADTLHSISNTAYPGKRIVQSGGYNPAHFLSGSLDVQLKSDIRASHYVLPGQPVNQSEVATYISFAPFLLLPGAWLLYRQRKKGVPIDVPLVAISIVFVIFLAWLFIPHLSILGSILQLNKVPQNRLIIGFCFGSVLYIILWIRAFQDLKPDLSDKKHLIPILAYCGAVLIVVGLVHYAIFRASPGYIGPAKLALLTLPIPISLLLFFTNRYVAATAIIALLSVYSTYNVNPLYRGLSVDDSFPVSTAIRETEKSASGTWVGDAVFFENFPAMQGARSLSGVYLYPQLHIWDSLNQDDKRSMYNRYAHMNFIFDVNPQETVKPTFETPGADQFKIKLEACDPFLDKQKVKYMLTSTKLDETAASCTDLVRTVDFPYAKFFIYMRN